MLVHERETVQPEEQSAQAALHSSSALIAQTRMGIENSEICFHLDMSVMQSPSSSSQLPVVVSPYRKSSFFCLLIMIRAESLLLLQVSKAEEGISNQMLRILPDTSLPGLTQACFNAYHYWDHFSFPALTDDNNFKEKKTSWKAIKDFCWF